MALHLIKLCVGAASIEDLAQWQAARIKEAKAARKPHALWHGTFQRPKREAELLDGGSLYWVIKGVISVRQRLVGLADGAKPDGSPCCLLLLDPKLVPVRPAPRKAFQGWRYLTADDAPPDLPRGERGRGEAPPPKMLRDLAELGLL
jgi:hypothetical protein